MVAPRSAPRRRARAYDAIAMLDLPSSALAIAAFIHRRELSAVEVVDHYLAVIERRNPALAALIGVRAGGARRAAVDADRQLARGAPSSPLFGLPTAIKDDQSLRGHPTRVGTRVLDWAWSPIDGVTARACRRAGLIPLAKSATSELAILPIVDLPGRPPTRNPIDPSRYAGGSSGGAAAAVAGGLLPIAPGSDGAGSIRIPAAFCGVVGFMPSLGLVSTRGALPLSWSYDRIGPLTHDVHDAALVLAAIAGYDADDVCSQPLAVADYPAAVAAGPRRLRVGVPRAQLYVELDPEVEAAVARALAALTELGAELREVSLPLDDDRTVFRAEAWAYHRDHVARAPERYQAETLRRLRTGESVTAAAYLERARELVRVRRAYAAALADLDLVVAPTVAVPAPTFTEVDAAPDELRARELVFMRTTRPFSVWGAPALSVPCGATRAGLPIGVTLAGAHGADAAVLAAGAALARTLPPSLVDRPLPPLPR